MASTLVSELIGRSNRLGAGPRDTDHAGARHAGLHDPVPGVAAALR